MIVTRLEKQKGTMYKLFLDDGQSFYIDIEVIYFNHIKVGSVFSDEHLYEIVIAEQQRLAKAKALYLLGIKDYTCKEMYDKLSPHYMEEVCASTIAKMIELGFLDDEKLAGKLARHCLLTKKWGESKTIYYIRQKGIDAELTKLAVAECLEGVDIVATIVSIIEKKYKNKLGDYKQNQKVIAGLARLGYNYSDIKTAISQYIDSELKDMKEYE